ncbi:hypothetical protein [Neobacillus kokaensis]|uniref:Uncharacterized protein n=1 Tax=Neobacillus kokaensis TaxID=2759023 RepID=A0ABQ3N776_9BACI|nr:hypothetical protein [Neobacillus kokaensis]GHH99838.1 hypothetical protein AM1BK_33810 [Neobacillus kokaensis]
MEQISLSIEELIYSFYSEGFFEQGNALKQVYFGDLDDEKMDLLLQISCRSLLAKNLLDYKNHKFTLTDNLAKIIAILNYSEQSIKLSRHSAEQSEETYSFHFGEGRIIKHTLHFDEQVHMFTTVTSEEVSCMISDFYRIGKGEEADNTTISITQEEFEELLSALNDNKKQFDLRLLSEEKKRFYQILKETDGFLNTLLLLEFTDTKEPLAKNVWMFTNRLENNWMVEKQGENFIIKPCDEMTIKSLLEKDVFLNKEKEMTNYGSHY